jgi:hypothetical protein
MMVVGWGRKTKSLGSGPIEECGRCSNVARRVIVEHFKYFSIFFVPLIRSSRFLDLCPVCHDGYTLDSRQAAYARVAAGRRSPAVVTPKIEQPEVRQCLQCGLLNDLHAQTCKKCGTGMSQPVATPVFRTA